MKAPLSRTQPILPVWSWLTGRTTSVITRSVITRSVIARASSTIGHGGNGWVRLRRAGVTMLFAGLMLAVATHAFAVNPDERLANPQLEARAEAIGRTLRCLVCQNESIEESNASLAHDIRVLLRQLLVQGDTDAQARAAIVARYGEFVLLKPPVQPATYVLWFAPGVLLVGGFIGTVIWLRRRPADTPPEAPLTPQEQSRLDSLLHEAEH